MANLDNIARPYALAAFESAREKQQLAEWKAFFEAAALITRDHKVVSLLNNPEIQSPELFELYENILHSLMSEERKNLLHLLALNHRLIVLPEISHVYNACVEALEKISNVRVITAIDTEEAFRQKLVGALTKRIQRDVKLECEVDPTILGGAIIYIGDHVIDGSIRGKLTRLLEFSLR